MPRTRTSALLLLLALSACDCDGAGISQVDHRLAVDPPAIDFGVLTPNQRAQQSFFLINEGRATIDLDLEARAPFTLGPWPNKLAPGDSARVWIEFTSELPGEQLSRIELHHDAEGPTDIELRARVSEDAECAPSVDPEEIHFDGFDTAQVTITNHGNAHCKIEAINLEGRGFEVAATAPIDLFANQQPTTIEVRRTTGTEATLILTIDGDEYEVELTAPIEGPRLCVTPQAIVFASAAETRQLELESCGAQPLSINTIAWAETAPELALENLPAFPLTLDPGESVALAIRYSPRDELADRASLMISSNDPIAPALEVPVTTSPEMLPEEVGRYLYYWSITDTEGSNIMKLPLQGAPTPTPFWGESTGQGCPGCHQISPDGRYVAITELAELDDAVSTYVVDTTNNRRIDLYEPATSAIGFSWRPDVTGSPSYRFAFASGGKIHLGSLFDGYLGELPGSTSEDEDEGQAMPSWGSNGQIVFVRGYLDDEGFGFYDYADLYTIPENGGTAIPVEGASDNGKTNYYPTFSPDGRWIAYTETLIGETYSAPDAKVRLVRADGSGVVSDLDQLNGAQGATTFPSWSIDGTYLSVSSNRAGGVGDWDVYVARIDPISGADDAAANVAGANSAGFEHGAQWSP